MSGAIGPGDWVECVDAGPPRPRPGKRATAYLAGGRLTLGKIYQVSGFSRTGDGLILTAPETAPHTGWGWWPERFRPIYRPKSEIIQSLLQPAPELEPA